MTCENSIEYEISHSAYVKCWNDDLQTSAEFYNRIGNASFGSRIQTRELSAIVQKHEFVGRKPAAAAAVVATADLRLRIKAGFSMNIVLMGDSNAHTLIHGN